MVDVRFRAWNKKLNIMTTKVVSIDWYKEKLNVRWTHGGVETYDLWAFSDVILEQYTGIVDSNDELIFEGAIVQPVRDSRSIGGSIVNIGKPFVVKPGNYVYTKWIAEQVEDGTYGVRNYNLGSALVVIGNVHEDSKLLEK